MSKAPKKQKLGLPKDYQPPLVAGYFGGPRQLRTVPREAGVEDPELLAYARGDDIRGVNDPDRHDMWENEYVRWAVDTVEWEPTGVPGVGRITQVRFESSGHTEERIARGERIIVVEQPASLRGDYVDTNELVVKPRLPLDVRVTGTIIRGLPPGTTLTIDGQVYPAGDSEVDLGLEVPGTYEIRVEAPTHLPTTITLVKP